MESITISQKPKTSSTKLSAKDLILSKESPTAENLSFVEKNIILGEYPNSMEGSARLFKKTDTHQDNWINFVILALLNNCDPYRQSRTKTKTLSQAQLHYHAQREAFLSQSTK
jgi:hypothetical protein